MTLPPQNLPAVGSDGAVMAHAGRYAKNAVLSVFDMLGGANGLKEWTKKSAQNEADFYTKIFTKTIQKDVEINDQRSIEDVLDAIDGEFVMVPNPAPAVSLPQDFSNFDTFAGGIVVGDVDYAGEVVDD